MKLTRRRVLVALLVACCFWWWWRWPVKVDLHGQDTVIASPG